MSWLAGLRRFLQGFGDLLLGLLLVAGVDLVLFHQGGYVPYLKPDSYAGRVEEAQRRYAASQAGALSRHVVVMSNSSAGACVDEAQLEGALRSGGVDLRVINLAQGGTTARAWRTLLSQPGIDPTSTALVVIGVHPEVLTASEDKAADLQVVKTRLALGDLASLPWSYQRLERQLEVATAIAFRTPLFRDDLVDLASDPSRRLAEVAAAGREEATRRRTGWRRSRQTANDLTAVHLGPDGRLDRAALPPRLAADSVLQGILERRLVLRHRGTPQPPMEIESGQAWMLEQTVGRLARRGIPVAIVVTPRTPVPLVGRPIGALEDLVGRLRAHGMPVVLLQDSRTLDQVEDLAHFADALHVNAAGASIFTAGLADGLLRLLRAGDLQIAEAAALRREG